MSAGTFGRGLCGVRIGIRSDDDRRCSQSAIVPAVGGDTPRCFRHRRTYGDGTVTASNPRGWTNACACDEHRICQPHAEMLTREALPGRDTNDPRQAFMDQE